MKTTTRNGSRHILFLWAAGLAAMLGAASAPAQVNKCLDANGKVVGYGSQCPPGTRSEATNIRSAPAPSASPGAAKSIAEQEADFRKRQVEKQDAQAKADKRASEDSEKKRACDSARSYLKTLQSGMRVARTDPNTGERVYLGDDERAREMDSAQRAVDTNCK